MIVRRALQDGVLVIQKRGWLLRWRWYFLRSLEDGLNKDLNDLVKATDMQRILRRRIPKRRAALKEIKDELLKAASHCVPPVGQATRDSWRPRKEPVKLLEDVKQPKLKKSDCKAPRKRPEPVLEVGLGTR